jgi:SAM-dependent methyltransferase
MKNTLNFWEENAKTSVPSFDWSQMKFADALAPLVRGKRVLDLGCGGGALSSFLKTHGASVLGLDYSPQMVALAASRNPDIEFVCGNVLDLDLNQQFDIVCGIAFLHEIDRADTPRLVDFMRRHLKPHGFGWFQENSFFNPFARFFRNRIVGHFGVPKYGSDDESPLDPARYELYKKGFQYCDRSVESFVLFSRIFSYLVRRGPSGPWHWADQAISASPMPAFLKLYFSYIQHIYFSNDCGKTETFRHA